jgi:hypothetical protein
MKEYDKKKPQPETPSRRRGVTIMILLCGVPLLIVPQLIVLFRFPDLAFPIVPIMGLTSGAGVFFAIMYYTRCRNCGAFWPARMRDARPELTGGAPYVQRPEVFRCRRCNEPLNR